MAIYYTTTRTSFILLLRLLLYLSFNLFLLSGFYGYYYCNSRQVFSAVSTLGCCCCCWWPSRVLTIVNVVVSIDFLKKQATTPLVSSQRRIESCRQVPSSPMSTISFYLFTFTSRCTYQMNLTAGLFSSPTQQYILFHQCRILTRRRADTQERGKKGVVRFNDKHSCRVFLRPPTRDFYA